MNEAQRDVALFRYSLIREAADESLTHPPTRPARARAGRPRPRRPARPARPRGARAPSTAGSGPIAPAASRRWPRCRARGEPVTEQAAVGPGRGAQTRGAPAHRRPGGPDHPHRRRGGPSERTLQRHFARLGLNTRPDGSAAGGLRSFRGRRSRATCGPATPCTGRSSPGARPTCSPSSTTTPEPWSAIAGGCPRTPSASKRRSGPRSPRGACPGRSTSTTAAPMVSKQLLRACASLGVRLVHSKPGRPQGRGKIERVFETVRIQFLVEVEARPPADLAELNRLFSAWVETVYHRRVHSETGEAPIERLLAGGPPVLPSPGRAARGVLVVRDPHGDQDGDGLAARQHLRGRRRPGRVARGGRLRPLRPGQPSRSASRAGPWARASRSSSAATRTPRPGPRPPPPPAPTGIDYLGLLAERRDAELARAINYAQLTLPGAPEPVITTDTTNFTSPTNDNEETQL